MRDPNLQRAMNSLLKVLDGQNLSTVLLDDPTRPFNFSEVADEVEGARRILRRLEDIETPIPVAVIASLGPVVQEVSRSFGSLLKFDFRRSEEPQEEHAALVKAVQAAEFKLSTAVGPVLAVYEDRLGDLKFIRAEAEETLRHVQRLKEDGERDRAAIQATLEAAREAVAETGVSQTAQVFNDEAKRYKANALRWLSAMIGSSVAACLVAWWAASTIIVNNSQASMPQVIEAAAGRLVIVSISLFAVGFSAKTYSSSRHNEVVNRHRQNSLQTFQAFVEASDDETVRDTVLLEATRTIFQGVPSGYLKDQADSSAPISPADVFRVASTRAP